MVDVFGNCDISPIDILNLKIVISSKIPMGRFVILLVMEMLTTSECIFLKCKQNE